MIIDSHTHAGLSYRDYPNKIFGVFSKFLLGKKKRVKFAAKFLSAIIPTDKDFLERYARLLEYSEKSTAERIEDALTYCDKLNALSINLQYMGAGDAQRTYEEQMDTLVLMREKYKDRINIFMMLEPQDPNIIRHVIKYERFCKGWKYYPPVSGTINNGMIRHILGKHPKPIIIHTTDTSPIYNKFFKKKVAQGFAHPKYCIPLIEKFPNVPFIFAHLGGENWQNEVITLCEKYPNVYTDISFTFSKDHDTLSKRFHRIPEKILWGTDNHMTDPEPFLKVPYFKAMQKNNSKLF